MEYPIGRRKRLAGWMLAIISILGKTVENRRNLFTESFFQVTSRKPVGYGEEAETKIRLCCRWPFGEDCCVPFRYTVTTVKAHTLIL